MKTKIKFLIILIAAAAASLVAGCSVGRESYQDFVKRNDATCHITYHANGGEFETKQDVKEMYYKPDTCLINIGVDELYGSNVSITKDGYVFSGWCYPATDANGDLIYEDEAKTVVKLGEPFDFSYRLKQDDSFDLYATWTLDILIEIRLVSDTAVTLLTDAGENAVYNSGDVITYRTFGSSTQAYIRDEAPVTGVGYTFVQMYEDEDCNVKFSGTAFKPMGDDATNLVLYAKYIVGDWTVVKDKNGVSNMFTNKSRGRNFYIFDDIDCEGLVVGVETGTNCVIEGNGHTISNIAANRISITNSSYSLFGTMSATTEIRNVTFKGLSITFSLRDGQFNDGLYLVSESVADGAKFENFVIEDAVFNVSDAYGSSTIANIQIPQGSASYTTDNWLFGGEDTDDAFLSSHGGITFKDITLTVNGETVSQINQK